MKKFYIIEDWIEDRADRMGRSRIAYYVGYAFGLLQKFVIGAAVSFAIQFLYWFIVELFA